MAYTGSNDAGICLGKDMNPEIVNDIAEKIYLYRELNRIEGTEENDHELAVEYLKNHENKCLDKYCADMFGNTMAKINPLKKGGY